MSDIVTTKPASLPSAEREGSPIHRTPEEVRPDESGFAMTKLARLKAGVTPCPYDVERLIQRWREGRSPQTLRAYTGDLRYFATWMVTPSAGSAIDTLLRMGQGQANELVRTYRSGMVDKGVAPATINRRLSALRSPRSSATSLSTSPPKTCAPRPSGTREAPSPTSWLHS
jgi:hypothetical protein